MKIEVVLTPALLPLYKAENKTVVVTDILRATSTMCVAFQTGVKKILPVLTPEECLRYKDFDFLCAAERNAVKLEGFDLGNSPFEFQNPLLAGKNIAFTTTNGTKAIQLAKQMNAAEILIGSFLNLEALCNKIKSLNNDVILLCAGWKDKFNLEDTLFAGAVVSKIENNFSVDDDSALAAKSLYETHANNLENIVRQSSHAKRFQLLHLTTDDVAFCLQMNVIDVVPRLKGEYIEV